MKRRNSHVIPESGFYICEVTGTCESQHMHIAISLTERVGSDHMHTHHSTIFLTDELKFDNTYNRKHSKELFYSVKVVPPDTDELVAVPGSHLELPSNAWQGDRDSSASPDLETGLTNEAEEGAVGGEPVVT